MNYSTFRFTLNMHNHRSQVAIPVFLGDTGIRLLINLTDGGNPYFIEDGCTAYIRGKKADGKALFNQCLILNNTTIQYDFTEQTSNSEGITTCEVEIYGADGTLITAPKFIIVVDSRSLSDSEIAAIIENSDSEVNIIPKIISILESEGQRQANETERQNSETERREAELRREEAEAQREADRITFEEASALADSIYASASTVYEAANRVETIKSGITRNSKRITNLEQGIIPSPFETDSDVAYAKDVPENALPYAEISKVGGMTHKLGSRNVAGIGEIYSDFTSSKLHYSFDEDTQAVTISFDGGELVNQEIYIRLKKPLPIGTYTLKTYVIEGDGSSILLRNSITGKNTSFSASNYSVATTQYEYDLIGFRASQTVYPYNAFTKTFKVAIFKGDVKAEKPSFEPYIEPCLKDAKVTMVKSEGANLLNPNQEITRLSGCSVNLVIPEAIKSREDWGLGINIPYFNEIDFTEKIYTPCVRRLSDSEKTLQPETNFSYNNIVYYQLPKTGTVDRENTGTNILVSNFSEYKGSQSWDSAERIGTVTGAATHYWYWFGFAPGTTIEQAQAIINESDILVTVANAEGIDISDLITDDNLIQVEGNGMLIFENENKLDVPSEVMYQIRR